MTTNLFNYLEGDSSEHEKETFEQKMNENSNLKETVDLYKGIDDFVRDEMELEDVKKRVANIHSMYEVENKFSNKRTMILRWTSVAASIFIIIGIVSFATLFSDKSTAIYKNNYTAWEPRAITRGSSTEDVLTQWITYYNSYNYKAAIEKFELLPQNFKEHPQVLLMFCSALMENEEYDKALNRLIGFNLEGYSMFEQDFKWYRALCNLKLDNTQVAIAGFTELKESKKYSEKVDAILLKLE